VLLYRDGLEVLVGGRHKVYPDNLKALRDLTRSASL